MDLEEMAARAARAALVLRERRTAEERTVEILGHLGRLGLRVPKDLRVQGQSSTKPSVVSDLGVGIIAFYGRVELNRASEVLKRAFLTTATLAAILSVEPEARSQTYSYVHPRAPIGPEEFGLPKQLEGHHFVGPMVHEVHTKCWYAEPLSPNVPVGGEHGTQKVFSFSPVPSGFDDRQIDLSFRQQDISSFAAGGAASNLKAEAIPSGLYVMAKGHPVYKITEVKFPAMESFPFPFGPPKAGIKISADFLQEPSMGECYFYVAVWVVLKGNP